jgi:hypothetical protein
MEVIMKVKVEGWYTDIFLNIEEVQKLCKPGAGDDTCIFIVCGADGFQCACLHGSMIPSHMYDGEGNAKRKGCDFVKNIEPSEFGIGEFELEVE